MEFIVIYLFVIIEKIAAFLAIGGSIFKFALLGLLVSFFFSILASKDRETFEANQKRAKKTRVTLYCIALLGAFMFTLSAILPDKRELAVIIAGGVTYNVLTSEPAKEIGGKALELLKKEMDNAINEIPEKKNVSKPL